eukprot:scaffold124205_cov63-Phaeocystis_antarctica.AAC.1
MDPLCQRLAHGSARTHLCRLQLGRHRRAKASAYGGTGCGVGGVGQLKTAHIKPYVGRAGAHRRARGRVPVPDESGLPGARGPAPAPATAEGARDRLRGVRGAPGPLPSQNFNIHVGIAPLWQHIE